MRFAIPKVEGCGKNPMEKFARPPGALTPRIFPRERSTPAERGCENRRVVINLCVDVARKLFCDLLLCPVDVRGCHRTVLLRLRRLVATRQEMGCFIKALRAEVNVCLIRVSNNERGGSNCLWRSTTAYLRHKVQP